MNRCLLIAPVLALLGAAPAANPDRSLASPTRIVSPVPSTCANVGSFAQGDRQRPQLKRLVELPPAEPYMAVYRTDDKGCIDPMLASERQGLQRQR